MANAKVFKDSFRGYKKEDVNSYIASMAEGMKKTVEEAEARVARAERERDEAKAELEIANKKADELAIDAFSAMQALSDKDDQIAGLTAYLAEANENASGVEEKIKEAVAEKEAEVKELSEKLAIAEKAYGEARTALFEKERELGAKLLWTDQSFNSKINAGKKEIEKLEAREKALSEKLAVAEKELVTKEKIQDAKMAKAVAAKDAELAKAREDAHKAIVEAQTMSAKSAAYEEFNSRMNAILEAAENKATAALEVSAQAQMNAAKTVEDAQAKAAQIIADAEAKAMQIIADAQAKAEEMNKAAAAEKDGILAAFTAEMREGVDSLLKGTEELKTRLATVETATAKKPRAPRKKKEAEVAPAEEVIELPTEEADNK